MKAFDKIKALIAATETDVAKFDKGNKAAGTRVRAVLMEIKNLAHEGRKEVVEVK